MTKNLLIVFVPIYFLLNINSAFSQFDYSGYDSLLQKYVAGKSVNYKQLLIEQDKLLNFTTKLSQISPKSHPENFKTNKEQLAYWINAYNACILKLILENYPVESIKDINFIRFTVWLKKNEIGGDEISFKSLEDDIIRDGFKDPRIHFAINCASFSCPPLINRAYFPDSIENQMEESTKSFVNDENNFRVDEEEKTLYLSSIFDWYDDDFYDWLRIEKNIEEPHILDYIQLYYNNQIRDEWYSFEIDFFDYNWQLNDNP
jgi:hypothetical protein